MLSIGMATYGQPLMMAKHMETIASYPEVIRSQLRVIVVDDCGEPPFVPSGEPFDLRVFRVNKDIPWNQCGCRNLVAHVAADGPMLLLDPDMVFPAEMMDRMLQASYKLVRGQVVKYGLKHVGNGQLDMTSPNTYMLYREDFLACGGYHEGYAGHKGWSDVELLDILSAFYRVRKRPDLFADFYSTREIPDAAVTGLDRSTKHNRSIRIKRHGQAKAVGGWVRFIKSNKSEKLRFPWMEVTSPPKSCA